MTRTSTLGWGAAGAFGAGAALVARPAHDVFNPYDPEAMGEPVTRAKMQERLSGYRTDLATYSQELDDLRSGGPLAQRDAPMTRDAALSAALSRYPRESQALTVALSQPGDGGIYSVDYFGPTEVRAHVGGRPSHAFETLDAAAKEIRASKPTNAIMVARVGGRFVPIGLDTPLAASKHEMTMEQTSFELGRGEGPDTMDDVVNARPFKTMYEARALSFTSKDDRIVAVLLPDGTQLEHSRLESAQSMTDMYVRFADDESRRLDAATRHFHQDIGLAGGAAVAAAAGIGLLVSAALSSHRKR
jgi:hypothetical protein